MAFRTFAFLVLINLGLAAEPSASGFMQSKTFFQTNVGYDPRLAIAVDAVVVHRHGDSDASLKAAIDSWKSRGFPTGRMFFSDSDATNAYWTGKWDGQPKPEEVEKNQKGEVVKCAGIRPYMLPTPGWTRYLEEMTLQSIRLGADAILPEEPLAHVNTGYEKAFREAWEARYKIPWEPENASPRARFLTAQLKTELYLELEVRLAKVTREAARKAGRPIPFLLPVHGLYSNVASTLTAPMGLALDVPEIDGYVGQIWTGPINWVNVNYSSPDRSFFSCAYALYDYFVEVVAGSDKQLWLLADPVEDDPNHKWSEFEQWYRHSAVAKLMFPRVDKFEVMPWPDRIFLPGFSTGGSTPAPADYRTALLSVIQVLQEVPEGGEWCHADAKAMKPGAAIGVALADSVLWEKEPFPPLDGTFGLLLPLVHAGVPASACVMERANDAGYMSRFKTIVLSYENFKPIDAKMHAGLAGWVKGGGSLIILGAVEDFGDGPFWWRKAGFPSPLHHLAKELGIDVDQMTDTQVGKGWVLRRATSPREYANPARVKEEYLPLLKVALAKAGVEGDIHMPGHFCLRRGPFVIAHAMKTPLDIKGKLVDIFDARLPIRDGARLEPGSSGLYRDVTRILSGSTPQVLHATHRLMRQTHEKELSIVEIKGPAETPAAVRFYTAGRTPREITVVDHNGRPLAVDVYHEGPTLLAKFINQPDGARLRVLWP